MKPESSRQLTDEEELLYEIQTGYETGNGIFYKSVDDRTSPERSGERYDSIEDEFRNLARLNAVAPEFFVTPLNMTFDEDGNPDGYFMEQAPGHELNDYTNTFSSSVSKNRDPEELDTEFIIEQAEYLENIMNLYGESHGDLHPRNLRVNPENSRIKGYDPVGYDPKTAGTEEARETDRERIDEWINDLEAAS
ncbi:MAG: hypothetical protein ABEJ03_00655 [Candidatus Nanohaloarchaea archaeon]